MAKFDYDDLQNNLVNWAEAEENVRALIIVGSRARTAPPPDQFSDLDAILFCRQPSRLTESNQWLRDLGPFWLNYLEKHGNNEPEQFALYDNALKIDVMIIEIGEREDLQSRLTTFPYMDVLQRGCKVLLDKTDSHAEVIIPPIPVSGKLPQQAAFDNHIHQALLMVIKCMRYLKRNDLWRSHAALNDDLKNNLLVLLEWEALAVNTKKDVWYNGRFINQWGNPDVVSMFPQIFIGYQEENLLSGLELFLRIYYGLALKIAKKLGLKFPKNDFKRVLAYLSEFKNSI